MIIFDKALSGEIDAFAHEAAKDNEEAVRIAEDTYAILWMLEQHDDMNGTNELEHMLEHKSIAWIAREYGLVN